MKKIFRIRPAMGRYVICIVLSLAFLAYGFITDNSWLTMVFGPTTVCLVLYALFYWVDFGSDEICINHLFIKRRIAKRRISSIEVARLRSGYNLIICIDGHRPYIPENDNGSLIQSFRKVWRKKFFSLSFKVIAVPLPYLKCKEYIEVLNDLYGNVRLEKKYMDFQSQLDQAIHQSEDDRA